MAAWITSFDIFPVSVQCNQQDMLLALNFDSPFYGRVYTKGNPSQCFVNGNGQTQLQVSTLHSLFSIRLLTLLLTGLMFSLPFH